MPSRLAYRQVDPTEPLAFVRVRRVDAIPQLLLGVVLLDRPVPGDGCKLCSGGQCSKKGNCWFYDPEKMRLYLLFTTAGGGINDRYRYAIKTKIIFRIF